MAVFDRKSLTKLMPQQLWIFSLLLLAVPALAHTVWTDGIGDWFTPSNWSAGVPNFVDDAEINNGGTAQIGSPGAKAGNLYLGVGTFDSGNLLISGSGILTNSSGLLVGLSGSGVLTVQNGGAVSDFRGFVGTLADSNGSAVVEGAGSR